MYSPQHSSPGRPGGRRPARRRQPVSAKAILMPIGACLAVVLGIVGLGRLLNPPSLITQTDAIPPSKTAGVVQTANPKPTVKPSASESEADDPSSSGNVGGAAQPQSIPCYSEDAFIISYLQVKQDVQTHPLLEQLSVDNPGASSSSGSGSSSGGTGGGSVALTSSGAANAAAWKKSVNSDTVGWIKVPGSINIGVVQGPNTNYYTNLEYDKRNTGGDPGVVWASSSCNLGGGSGSLSPNTVLFGHRWEYATPRGYFAPIMNFKDIGYAQNHPYIYFSTTSEDMVWQVFAAFYTDIDFNYVASAGGQYIIDGAKARSEHIYDVPVSSSDKILTLSTCTRHWGPSDRQRWVVMAKLVSDTSGGTPSITSNPNPIRPNV